MICGVNIQILYHALPLSLILIWTVDYSYLAGAAKQLFVGTSKLAYSKAENRENDGININATGCLYMNNENRKEYYHKITSKETKLISEAKILKKNSMPKMLYQYRIVNEYSLSCITSSSIYLASPTLFNDPYDCPIRIDWSDITTILPIMGVESFDITIKEMYDEMHNYRNNFYISCFCEEFDSLLLWSHYANKHTGICIGYEILSDNNYLLNRFHPIYYNESLNNINLFFADVYTYSLNTSKKEKYLNRYNYLKYALIKLMEWEYEKEWRLVEFGINMKHFFELSKPAIVYLGSRISNCNKELVKTLAAVNNIPVYQVEFLPNFHTSPVSPFYT